VADCDMVYTSGRTQVAYARESSVAPAAGPLMAQAITASSPSASSAQAPGPVRDDGHASDPLNVACFHEHADSLPAPVAVASLSSGALGPERAYFQRGPQLLSYGSPAAAHPASWNP